MLLELIAEHPEDCARCEKRLFGTVFVSRTIFLPRQARDKHREQLRKERRLCRPHSISLDYPLHLALARSAPPELIARIIGAEHALSSFFGAIFNAKMDYFTKTGSGQTSKKHSKREMRFFL